MPWNEKDYPASMKNLDEIVRKKAIDIGNKLVKEGYKDESAIPMNITDLDWNLMRYRAYQSLEASGLKKITEPKLYHICYYC